MLTVRTLGGIAKRLLAMAMVVGVPSVYGFDAGMDEPPRPLPVVKDVFVVGQGDVVRIAVFQSPELTLETRVDGAGRISYPFLGQMTIAGMSPAQIEQRLALELERREILKQPQVSVNVVQFRSQQVAVLGHVNRPGKYPLDLPYTVSDVLALAGGVTPNAADGVVLSRTINGERVNLEIDLTRIFLPGALGVDDPEVLPGDVLYAHRAPSFYIHGEVQRPGAFRLEREMTLQQALSAGGGLTPRGTLRGVSITRRGANGKVETLRAELQTPLRADDVITVPESWF